MNSKKLLSLFNLKWNPFSPDLPVEGIIRTPKFEQFCWRVENLALDGGFALITGDPGLGKSISMRALAEHLSKIREITVGEFSRPQSGLADFYRELGVIFGIDFKVSNRFGGYRLLREKWKTHIESTLLRPVLLIDEAQEMMPLILSELRLLSSSQFDSQLLITVVLAGDSRLAEKLKIPDLIPLGTRIRTRLNLEPYTKQELMGLFRESMERAGNEKLMTEELQQTLLEHCAGNPRILMTLAGEVLALGLKKETQILDESLYFEAFVPTTRSGSTGTSTKNITNKQERRNHANAH
jgi:type II secretory pathway predicted ATPase ExeA